MNSHENPMIDLDKRENLETTLDDLAAAGDHETLFKLALYLPGAMGRAAGCRSLAVECRLKGEVDRALYFEQMTKEHLEHIK